MGIAILDLDNFKQINDRFGHDSGDKVLQELAPRLQGCLRQSDTVARLGGDEFAFVLEDIQDKTNCISVIQKILDSLNKPTMINLNGMDYRLSASIGISIFPNDSDNVETLIKYADMAMYAAKNQGDHFHFYKS